MRNLKETMLFKEYIYGSKESQENFEKEEVFNDFTGAVFRLLRKEDNYVNAYREMSLAVCELETVKQKKAMLTAS